MDGRARMLRWVLPIALACTHACGGRTPAEPDGGAVDAGPWEPDECWLVGYREGPWLTEDDVRACASCVEPHVRLANPLSAGGSNLLHVAPVPGGLLITDYFFGTMANFLSVDGEPNLLTELPHDEEPLPNLLADGWGRDLIQEHHDRMGIEWSPSLNGWRGTSYRALPIPGTSRTWIGTFFRAANDFYREREDWVLYEYGPEGWQRLASTHLHPRGTLGRVVLTGGEIVGRLAGEPDGPSQGAMVRLRALEDGSVDILERDLILDMEFPTDSLTRWVNVMTWWALPVGDVAIVVSEGIVLDGVPQTWRTWLGVFDGELEMVHPWRLLGMPVDDPDYVWGEAPSLVGPWQTATLPDGRTYVVLNGTLAGTDAAPLEHLWGLWIDDEGQLEQEPPGLFLNPNHYNREQDAMGYPYVSAIVRGLPGGRAGVMWHDFWWLDDGHAWGQVVEPDGEVVFAEPQSFGPFENERTDARRWAQDGAGHAYLRAFWFDTGPVLPSDPRYDDRRLSVQRVGAELQYEWPEPTVLQTCPEYIDGVDDLRGVGAADEGTWQVWADRVPTLEGRRMRIHKVTLIRPDGTFAWE
jgi:hypothetical protein